MNTNTRPHRCRAAGRGLLTCLALTAGLGQALAQSPPRAPLQIIPDNGMTLRIERMEEVPPKLAAALERAECRLDDATLLAFQVEIFRPSPVAKLIALAPCRGDVLHGRAFLFDAGLDSDLRPITFAMMALPGRTVRTDSPGLLTWNPLTRLLVSIESNDVCEGMVTRHTWRQGVGAPNGFTLIRVERGRSGCGAGENWQVMWERPE
jgi:hypothetical protein